MDFIGQVDYVGAVNRMLVLLKVKMAWVFEEPYLVWQVCCGLELYALLLVFF